MTAQPLNIWTRPGRCEAGLCVLVRITPTVVEVRDSKTADSPVLAYTHDEWRRIALATVAGRPPCVARLADGTYAWVGRDVDGVVRVLLFDSAEMWAFTRACRDGQYRLPPAETAVEPSILTAPPAVPVAAPSDGVGCLK